MSVNINLQHIASAINYELHCTSGAFDTVVINDTNGACVTLFLPDGTGKAVADAINAAIASKLEAVHA